MKKHLFLVLVILMAFAVCLTACDKDSKEIVSISVVDGTMAYEYEVGETPDLSGIQVVVSYNDGSKETVTADKLQLSDIDTSFAGTRKLKITYNGFEYSIDITVKETTPPAPTLTEIKIVPSSIKTTVQVGETLDMSNIQVEAVFSNGSVKVLGYSDITVVSAPDTSASGEGELKVSYGGFEASIKITVSGIASITVVDDSVKNEIYVGDTLDITGLSVIVTYSDGTSEIVDYANLTVGTVDTSEMGEKKLAITYRGFTYEYTVAVAGVVSLEVNAGSVSTSVKVFDTLDTSKITAQVTYSNGVKKPVEAKDLTVGTVDTATAGDKDLTVSYAGISCTVAIKVVGVESITVITGSFKNEILIGEALETATISANVVYTDGTTEVIGADKLTVGTIDSSSAGKKALAVTFLDKSIDYEINVCGVEAIRVEGVSKVVTAGESLDLSAMKVYAIYSDSKKTEKLLDGGYTTNIDELDFDKEGSKTLKVTYKGALGEFSTDIVIETDPPELVALELRTYEAVIGLGMAYDKTKITAIAKYGNDTTEIIPYSLLAVADISTTEAGAKTLSVSYTEDGITKTSTGTVKVLPISSLNVSGIDTLVNKGDVLNTDNVKVAVTYSDGESTLHAVVGKADGVTVSVLDTGVGGDSFVKVSYLGSTVDYAVHVKAVASVKIVAGSYPTYVRYGYTPDVNNLTVEITYTNLDKEVKLVKDIADATVDCYDITGANATIKVTYDGISDTVNVEVLQIDSISALNGTVPASLPLGSPIPKDQIKLTVVYKNAAGQTFTYLVGTSDANLGLTDVDTTKPGEKAIVFTFMGYSTSIRIMVNGIDSISVVPGTIQTIVNKDQDLDTAGIKVRVQYTDGSYIYVDTTSIYLTVGTVDTSSAGIKKLSVKYQEAVIYIDIEVKDIQVGDTSMIFGVSLPSNITARESYKTNFKLQDKVYVVGDDNPYIFTLVLLMLDDDDNLVDTTAGYVSASMVYLVDGATETLVGEEYVVIDENKNSFDFTEAAIGKTFKIVSGPASAPEMKRSHVVTVVDAYNIYNAKELNFITNVDSDLNGGSMEGHLGQMAAIDNFLAANNMTRPANLHGVVLHSNLDIKESDIPAEYIYEASDGTRGFYDHISMYKYYVDSTNPTFRMYGNYYSVYSYNLPCVVPNGYANNDDAFSSTELFRFSVNRSMFSESFSNEGYIVDVNDMAFRDNDPNSNDQSASERHMRGLLGFKISFINFNFNNSNIEAYTTSMVPEDDYLTVNINDSKLYNAWQGHIFIWNNNYLNDYLGRTNEGPFANYQNIKIFINNSLVAKCGGPVILSQCKDPAYVYNSKSGADIIVDDKSELYSYVTGQEAWFVAVGQTQLAGQILAMNQLVNGTATAQGLSASYTSSEKITGVNTVNMIMVCMGVGSTITGGEDYDGTMTVNGVTGLNMTNNPYVDAYVQATGGQAPIFQSSAGGTCYTDGKTGIYTQQGIATKESGCFDGDYLTLYFMGIGVMLEYYH